MTILDIRRESWPLAESFAISRGARDTAELVLVSVRAGEVSGRGECVPYAHYGETVEGVMDRLHDLAGDVKNGLGRAALQDQLGPGAARNALDCAFWDLEAKQSGRPVWQAAGQTAPPGTLITAFTLGLDRPEVMAEKARRNSTRPLFKLKLTGEGDLDRVAAVRAAVPGSRLIVDANESWSPDMVEPLSRELQGLGVAMIEQPLPAAADAMLADIPHPVPLCADESAHARDGFAALTGKYEMINIKLDKTGGLTEALALRHCAQEAGMGIMVGCMVATSLAMAPAVILAQGAAIVDLDGPLLLRGDRAPGLTYDGSILHPPAPELWG